MISFDLTAAIAFTVGFVLVATVALALAASAATRFVATNRPVRLARHESMRTYYSGLLLSH